MTNLSPRLRLPAKIFGGTAAAALAVTGFFGVLHTSWGRPLMARMGMGCPVKKITPEQAEAVRQGSLDGLRGTQDAKVRPALGLTLDGLTEDDALAWGAKGGGDCKRETRGFHLVTCTHVSAASVGEAFTSKPIDFLSLAFNPQGKLINVDAMRTHLTADEAVRMLNTLRAQLSRELGDPGELVGEATAENLAAGPMHMALVKYQFANYLASIHAMNLPSDSGITLRERYASAAKTTM